MYVEKSSSSMDSHSQLSILTDINYAPYPGVHITSFLTLSKSVLPTLFHNVVLKVVYIVLANFTHLQMLHNKLMCEFIFM